MKKLTKRITALVLSAVLLLGTIPGGALAAAVGSIAKTAPTVNDTYVIGNESQSAYLLWNGTSLAITNSAADATVWTVVEGSSADSFALYNGSYYLSVDSDATELTVNKDKAYDWQYGSYPNNYLTDGTYYICPNSTGWGLSGKDETCVSLYAVTDATDATNDDFYRIVHLDCGRQYFTVQNIKDLIDVMAKSDFNQLQLAFGNDGLRFLLDDMALDIDGDGIDDYSHTEMMKIDSVGNASLAGGSGYLTENEMSEIIAYAATNSIEIVPHLNMPGHMNAILATFSELKLSGNSMNLESTTAVNFATALLAKYVAYFDGKGCQFFHIGQDEYGNDYYTNYNTFGFGYLIEEEKYNLFGDFINACAKIVKDAGMTPRAWNDGIYAQGNTTCGTIDPDIQVTYWSSGYSGYTVSSASSLSNKGHDMINSHGDWYFISGSGNDHLETGVRDASDFDCTSFMGSEISDPVGAMFCIWCDHPTAESSSSVITSASTYIRAIGQAMQDTQPVSDTGSGEGGEDTDTVEPTDPNAINITMNVGDTHTETIADKYYTTYTDSNPGIVDVTVTGTEGSAETTVSTTPATILENGATYLLRVTNSTYALTTNTGKRDWGTRTLAFEYCNLYAESDTMWTLEASGEGYKLKSAAGYLNLGSKNNTAYVDTIGEVFSIKKPSAGWTVKNQYGRYINALGGLYNYYSAGGYPSDSTTFDFYKVTQSGTSSTEVTFTAESAGTTVVTVGHVTYNVTVYDAPTSTLPVELWITNGLVQADGALSGTRSDNGTYTYYYVNVPDTAVNSESGADIASFIPKTGTNENRPVDYWKVVYLPDGTDQSTASGSDYTLTTDIVTKVRYWENKWSVYVYNLDSQTYSWIDVDKSTDQLIAYYLMHTELISDEISIEAHTKDWGFNSGEAYYNKPGYCTVSIQIVFPDGSTNPDTENDDAYTALIPYSWVFNYWEDRPLGYYQFDLADNSNYEIYRITDTLGTPDLSGNVINGFAWNTVTENSVTRLDETILRDVPQGENLGSSVAIYSTDENPIAWNDSNKAHLIRVYVRPTTEASSLTVRYIDNMTGTEFYTYGINAQEREVFNSKDANFSVTGTIGKEIELTAVINRNILNSSGVYSATVTSDVISMPEISAQYRYCTPVCTHYEIWDANGNVVRDGQDGTTLVMYYDFTPQRLYVLDFGLPLTLTHAQYGTTENNEVTDIEIYNTGTVRYGTLEETDNFSVKYTMSSPLPGIDAYTVIVHYAGEVNSVAYHLYFIPASNMMYEENFFTNTANAARNNWASTGSSLNLTQTNPLTDTVESNNARYGYDAVYSATGYSNGTALSVTGLTPNKASNTLTTEFYGSGFDLIGDCDPSTSAVMLLIQDASTRKPVKALMIDTRYSGGTLHQVPLGHVSFTSDGNYIANVTAYYLLPQTVGYATLQAYDDGMGLVMRDLARYGLTLADVDFVYFDENSPFAQVDGATQSAYASGSAALMGTIERPAGDHAVIDGFRVYRSSATSSTENLVGNNYISSEQNVTYTNILDAFDTAGSDGKSLVAYTEVAANGKYTEGSAYETNGPQNEIYLAKNQAVTFKIPGLANSKIQISARAVTDAAVTLNYAGSTNDTGKVWNISSNTEMYYFIDVASDGLISITNTSDGILALAFLKYQAGSGATLASLDDGDMTSAYSLIKTSVTNPVVQTTGTVDPELPSEHHTAPEIPNAPSQPTIPSVPAIPSVPSVPVQGQTGSSVFQPEKLEMKTGVVTMAGKRYVKLTVTASTDVDKLTINGTPVWATNLMWVHMGQDDEYVYTKLLEAENGKAVRFDVVAYNKAGQASKTYTQTR